MSTAAGPNTAQLETPKVLGHAQNEDAPITVITGTNGGSTTLNLQQMYCRVIPPASGVHTVVLPQLSLWKGRDFYAYSTTSAPGGEVKFAYAENGNDAVGDNIYAAGDRVKLHNCAGEFLFPVTDVTTSL